MMRTLRKTLYTALCTLMLVTVASCARMEDDLGEPQRITVPVQIGIAPVVNGITGRATAPLDAEDQNRIHNLTFFQFDSEGFHNRSRDYQRIDSINVVSYQTTNLNFFTGQSTIVCLANVDKEEVDAFYRRMWAQNPTKNEGEITLDQFKAWKVEIPYVDYASTATSAVDLAMKSNDYEGLPTSMPMSGMFSGIITTANRSSLTIMLGRMVTQLTFTVTFDSPINKAIGYEFFNVGEQVHVFPGVLAQAIDDPLHTRFIVRDYSASFPVGATTTRYFYIAPTNAGADSRKAIRGDIYYGQNCYDRFGVPSQTSMGYVTPPSPDPVRPNARVLISCVGEEDRDNVAEPYSLQANTIYHISLHLKVENSAIPYEPNQPVSGTSASSRAMGQAATEPQIFELDCPTAVAPDGTLEYSVILRE